MFSTTLLEMSWRRVRRRFTGPFYVSCPCSTVWFVWFGFRVLRLYYFLLKVFILKRHISLRNGADVFICWFNDCLSNITWNKTVSEDSVCSQLLSLTDGFAHVTICRLKVYPDHSRKCLPVPQDPPTRPTKQSLCRRNKPHMTEKEHVYYNSVLNTVSYDILLFPVHNLRHKLK